MERGRHAIGRHLGYWRRQRQEPGQRRARRGAGGEAIRHVWINSTCRLTVHHNFNVVLFHYLWARPGAAAPEKIIKLQFIRPRYKHFRASIARFHRKPECLTLRRENARRKQSDGSFRSLYTLAKVGTIRVATLRELREIAGSYEKSGKIMHLSWENC